MPYINPKRPLIILRIEWIGFILCLILFLIFFIGAGILSPTIIHALAVEACTECTEDNEEQWNSLIDEKLGQSVFLIALLTIGFFGVILLVIQCGLNILLRNGIFEESSKKCQSWIIIHGVLLLLSVMFIFSRIAKHGSVMRSYLILVPILGWIYRMISLFILKQYLDKLKRRDRRVPNGISSGDGDYGGHGLGRFGQDSSVQSTMTEMTDIPL